GRLEQTLSFALAQEAAPEPTEPRGAIWAAAHDARRAEMDRASNQLAIRECGRDVTFGRRAAVRQREARDARLTARPANGTRNACRQPVLPGPGERSAALQRSSRPHEGCHLLQGQTAQRAWQEISVALRAVPMPALGQVVEADF